MGKQITKKGAIQILSITVSCCAAALLTFGLFLLVSALSIPSILLALLSSIFIISGIIPIVNTYHLLKSYNERSLREFILIASIIVYFLIDQLLDGSTRHSYGYAFIIAVLLYYLSKKYILPKLMTDAAEKA